MGLQGVSGGLSAGIPGDFQGPQRVSRIARDIPRSFWGVLVVFQGLSEGFRCVSLMIKGISKAFQGCSMGFQKVLDAFQGCSKGLRGVPWSFKEFHGN